MIWKFELPLISRTQLFAKSCRFNDEVIWIFELRLLSRRKLFRKNQAVLLMQNQADLLMWLENLNFPYYHELKFSQKYGRFYKVTWNFALPLLSRGKIFPINKAVLLMWLEYLHCPYYYKLKFLQNMRQFWWCHLKI